MGVFDKLTGKGGDSGAPAEKAGGSLLGNLMGKKGGGDASAGGIAAKAKGLGGLGKKKGDGCATIFDESVPEVVIEDFRNSGLYTNHDGRRVYLGMLLDTNAIGGFGRKSHKDEQKGSIIECVNQGRIKVLATPELLNRDSLVFIPQAATLDAMGDFPLLTNADYMLVYVDEDCGVEDTKADVTWDNMRDVVVDHIDADTFLDQLGIVDGHGKNTAPIPAVDPNPSVDDFSAAATSDFLSAVPEINVVEPTQPITPDTSFDALASEAEGVSVSFEDDDEPAPEEPTMTFIPEGDIAETTVVEEDISKGNEVKETVVRPEDFIDIDDSINPDDDVDDFEAYIGEGSEGPAVNDDAFAETMVRKFFSDDLRLEVTTEPFDAQFLHLNAYIPFAEDRPSGWMNDYLNQYSRDANTELKRLHTAHLMTVREQFFNLMSMHAEAIQQELDINDPNTYYGKLKDLEDERRQEQLDAADSIIREKREAIQEAYDKHVSEAGIAAAQAAEQQYRDRYGRAHEEEMRNAETFVKESINNEYHDRLREINEERRAQASRRMDYGITETLHICSERYAELLKEEQIAFKTYREGINRFIEENRKDDIARANVLAEELRQSERANAVMTEYTEKINAMSAEFDTKRRELMAQLDSQASEYQATIDRLESTYSSQIEDLTTRNKQLVAKLDEYRDGMASMDASKENVYRDRIAKLENERDSWRSEVEQTRNMNKNRGFVTVGLALVAAIAAGAIGIYIGTTTNVDKVSDSATSAIIEEYNQKLAQLQSQQSADVERALRDSEAQAQADARASQAQSSSSSSSSSSSATRPTTTNTNDTEDRTR